MFKSETEFLQFAFSRYNNPHLTSVSEFEGDLKRFTYLNNLLNRYRGNVDDLKDRLILNHIVILGNCFTVSGSIDMLRYKIFQENMYIIDTCLYFLGLIENTHEKIDFYLLDILNAY
jgi:hypothetical protein